MLQIVELDVWGNAHDGFEVNQWFYTNNYVTYTSVRKLFRDLRKIGYNIPKGSYIEFMGDSIDVYARNGRPLLSLEEQ